MEEKTQLGKRSSLKIIAVFMLIGVLFAAVVISARGSLRPIFIGCALAALMKSMCNILYSGMERLTAKRRGVTDRRRKWFHVLSILLTYVIWFGIVYFFVSLVVPRFASALSAMVSSLPGFIASAVTAAETFINEQPLLSDYSEQIIETALNKITAWVNTDLTKTLASLANTLISGIGGTVQMLFDTLVGIIISFYLLYGRKKLAAQLKLVLYAMLGEAYARPVIDELRFANKMFSGYFMGSLIDSALVGIVCYIGTLVFGIPYGVLVAVIIGITNIIPFFGPYIGLIPSAVIILTRSPFHAVIFVIMMIVIQQIDGNIICPKIVGNTTGLSSFWVLFAILLFGGLFGFVGMLIGVPVFAVFYDIVEKIVRYSLDRRGEHRVAEAYDKSYPKEPDKPAPHGGVIISIANGVSSRLQRLFSRSASSEKSSGGATQEEASIIKSTDENPNADMSEKSFPKGSDNKVVNDIEEKR